MVKTLLDPLWTLIWINQLKKSMLAARKIIHWVWGIIVSFVRYYNGVQPIYEKCHQLDTHQMMKYECSGLCFNVLWHHPFQKAKQTFLEKPPTLQNTWKKIFLKLGPYVCFRSFKRIFVACQWQYKFYFC